MMKLSIIAIILASSVLVISLIPPIYNYFSAQPLTVTGEPSFKVGMLLLNQFTIDVDIVNNGTVAAHHVSVYIEFMGPSPIHYSAEGASELPVNTIMGFEFPIGEFQLKYGGWNTTQYTVRVFVSCAELHYMMNTEPFTYQAKSGYIVSP
jgi:hypothetical protein